MYDEWLYSNIDYNVVHETHRVRYIISATKERLCNEKKD